MIIFILISKKITVKYLLKVIIYFFIIKLFIYIIFTLFELM